MKVAIIIPTYNEKENIDKLISDIFSLGIDGLEIVVVDDNSPDGTANVIADMKKMNNKLHLINRPEKMGLGTAYIAGFKYALEREAQYVMEMDADFSHDPNYIPHFLSHMEQNDLVIGSRYIMDGKIENWDSGRLFVSNLGNLYARLILGMKVRDLTTGYKCYRRHVVEHLINKDINAVGYVFQIETTYHAVKKEFRVKEIPITFFERRLGKSKFDFGIIWESFWKVWKLKFGKD